MGEEMVLPLQRYLTSYESIQNIKTCIKYIFFFYQKIALQTLLNMIGLLVYYRGLGCMTNLKFKK